MLFHHTSTIRYYFIVHWLSGPYVTLFHRVLTIWSVCDVISSYINYMVFMWWNFIVHQLSSSYAMLFHSASTIWSLCDETSSYINYLIHMQRYSAQRLSEYSPILFHRKTTIWYIFNISLYIVDLDYTRWYHTSYIVDLDYTWLDFIMYRLFGSYATLFHRVSTI
jgi:hypothetical protein